MARDRFEPNVWKGRRLKVSAANPSELGRRLQEAIARQAYRRFESQGSSPGNEARDWEQAESEVVRRLACGLIIDGAKISICADIARFAEGDIEVYVEPRRLSLCGRPRESEAGSASPRPDLSCSVLDLPVEVEPSRTQTKLNGRILEIDLYRTPRLAQVA